MKISQERLFRLLEILDRQGGSETVRQLQRRFSILRQEVAQAEALGWIVIERVKPPVGRPAVIARKLSETMAAKLPPYRREMERPISVRHWNFAMFSAYGAIPNGCRYLNMPATVHAYRKAFPKARRMKGAAASCSRLLRHPNVFAARQWYYAIMNGEIPRGLTWPDTPGEIWDCLDKFGSRRAKFRTYRRKLYRR